MLFDYNYRNTFDFPSPTQSFEPQLDSNKIYKETRPKISQLTCKFPLPAYAWWGAVNPRARGGRDNVLVEFIIELVLSMELMGLCCLQTQRPCLMIS